MKVDSVQAIIWVVTFLMGSNMGYGTGNVGLESAIKRELEVRTDLICMHDPDLGIKILVCRLFNSSPSKEFW